MMNAFCYDIDSIIALIHILDKYEDFKQKLSIAMKNKYNKQFVWQLTEQVFGVSLTELLDLKKERKIPKVSKFYQENKEVIDTIQTYKVINGFIYYIYDHQESINCFYNYFLKNKDNIPKILEVLNRLKELGFKMFFINENADFANKTYRLKPDFSSNYMYDYLDNIMVIPSEEEDVLYKTNFSNYKITFTKSHGPKIELNTLIFDPNTLPNSLAKEDTFDKIIKLKEEIQEECEAIKANQELIGIINYLSNLINLDNKNLEDEKITPMYRTYLQSVLKVMEYSLEELRKIKIDLVHNNPILYGEDDKKDASLKRIIK